jgi:hypothetical protein
VRAAILLVGIVGFVWSALNAFRTRSLTQLQGATVVSCTAALWFVLPTNYIGAYIRARVESTGYEEVTRRAKAGESNLCSDRIYSCRVDAGPPLRVAFVWGGLVDNWVGTIYDPDNVILDATRFEKLFGGDMLWCQRLWENHYFCGFT